MSKTLVVKFGGHAITDDSGLFAAAIGSALAQGLKVVVIPVSYTHLTLPTKA